MGVSTIDGTVEEAVLGRRVWAARVFKRIVFRLPDGGTRTVGKSVVHADLAEYLQPGTSGRFYHFTAIDHRGFHGFRDSSGRAIYKFPRNNEILMLAMFLLMALVVSLSFAIVGDAGIIPTLVLLLSLPFWIYLRKVRADAQRQFAANGPYAPTAPTAPEPAVGV